MTSDQFADLRSSIPNKPGVYRYFDSEGNLLYVGKAKDLNKRVSSYFTGKNIRSARLNMLIRLTERIETTIVNSERDALFLENSIIKAQQPKYNVALRDDKSYPFIVIKNEDFPRIFFTRNVINDGSEYFGPYTSVQKSREVLGFIKKIYPIRTCNLKLTDDNIKAEKFKVCLEYHIKNCLGPCEAKQSHTDYDQNIKQIRSLLKGNISDIKQEMRDQMVEASNQLNFELANSIKQKLDSIDTFAHKSAVVNPKLKSIDVMGIASSEKYGFVNYMKVKEGNVIQVHTLEMKKRLDESDEDLIQYAFFDLLERGIEFEDELLLENLVSLPETSITVTVPKIGDKKRLLDLSTNNALAKLRDRELKIEQRQSKIQINPVLIQIKEDLRLKDLPTHIECFDNSNFQGDQPVASCVVFRNGKPSKSEYRHFNIKTVEGPNDFASMEEIVYRRYKRMIEEDEELPQLIIIDGGKGQLSSAVKSLKLLGIEDQVTIIGIAKKLEEIYYPGDQYPIHINKKSPTLRVIQHLRNEAHRFAITFHRSKRRKNTLKTELTNIPGVGVKTSQKLLREFKSIKKIREASKEELRQVVNETTAATIYDYFNKKRID